ncbi:MAG: glycosyl hydrolase family 28-related protein, partial [Acidobacteriota bacterium]
MKHLLVLSVVFAAFALTGSAQNRFEGHNIILDVPTTQRSTACAIRYAPPSTTATLTDLDRSTPMKVSSCSGSSTLVQSSGSTATMRANSADYKWCFQGEDKRYRITFPGDQYSGPITYDWIAEPPAAQAGYYNIRDFGAVGDGQADDTIAIRSAFAYIASKNGGTVSFPEGDYKVTSPIALPSGIVIQGTGAIMSGAPTSALPRKNPTRIKLSGTNRALFRIGECSTQITMRDIELYSESSNKTYGVEAVGAYDSAGGIIFERVVFNNFSRGIYMYGLPQTNLEWQVDYVKVRNCVFI